MNNIRIVFGSDHAGYNLKKKLIKHVMEEYRGCIDELLDTGCETPERVDYPDYAKKVAKELEYDNRRIGVLICGTGIGIGIAANRFEHIRCALCDDNFSAEMARKHNDANCLSLGARRTSFEDSCKILKIFINTEFEGGRHQKRLDKINHLKTMLSD